MSIISIADGRILDPIEDTPLARYLLHSEKYALMRDELGTIIWCTPLLHILLGVQTSLKGLPFEMWLQFLPDGERSEFRSRHRKALAGMSTSLEHELVTETMTSFRVISKMIPHPEFRGMYVEVLQQLAKSTTHENGSSRDPLLGARSANHDGDLLEKISVMNVMSHEFRTPMTGLLGFLQLLESDSSLSTDSKEFVDHALRSADNLKNTIDSMLELANVEGGSFENYPRFLSIRSELQSVIEAAHAAAARKKLYLKIHWPKIEHVFIDREMFRSVVRILLDNAIKFTSKGGVTLKFFVMKSTFTIQINDTGIGISNKDIPKVFEKYWQASQGENRKYGGMGIGLSLVKGYVDSVGGEIYFESKKNEGTEINVEFPMTFSQDDVDLITFSQSKRILIVEDDPILQLLIKRILNEFVVDTCFSGDEALERVKSVKYDAFILDIQLGKGMNGKELCVKLRTMKDYHDTPIAAATALNYERVIDTDSKLFTHYLPKPFNKDEMLNLVSRMLSRKEADG